MNMLKRIAELLELTKTERNVILFLAVTMIIGAAVRLYQSELPEMPQFNYQELDSTFTELNAAPEKKINTVGAVFAIGKMPGKLNINKATKQQLIDLPGIGKITAERILNYRKETGEFNTIEDLLAVKGISRKKLERLSSMIKTQ
jgi:competence protein ComEA